MSQAFVQLSNLKRTFRSGDKDQVVLQDATLEIVKGETVALLGRSGSGKSTLLNLMSGIDKPDQGRVLVDGIDLTALPEKDATLFRRHSIGFIYQFFNLIPTLTAAENIGLVLELNSLPEREIHHLTESILEAVGLGSLGSRFPDQLSGGEQQRVAIARALVHKPKLVLADELTGNLDAESGQHILDLLKSLVISTNSTLLLVTHSLAVANSADRIVTLEDGALAEREGHFAW
jgi:putative ABC transport system ATP-binding protein